MIGGLGVESGVSWAGFCLRVDLMSGQKLAVHWRSSNNLRDSESLKHPPYSYSIGSEKPYQMLLVPCTT